MKPTLTAADASGWRRIDLPTHAGYTTYLKTNGLGDVLLCQEEPGDDRNDDSAIHLRKYSGERLAMLVQMLGGLSAPLTHTEITSQLQGDLDRWNAPSPAAADEPIGRTCALCNEPATVIYCNQCLNAMENP